MPNQFIKPNPIPIQNKTEKQIYVADDVYNALNKTLLGYALATNAQESYELSVQIFNALVENKYIKDPEVLKKETIAQLKVGMSVMSQFSEDS